MTLHIMGGRFQFGTGDLIATIALLLSVGGVGWQAWEHFEGPDVSLLPLNNRGVEFRCLEVAESCWGDQPSDISVIIPTFVVNLGAQNQNEVVDRFTLSITFDDGSSPREMQAIAVWGGTQTSGHGDMSPFTPFVVPGAGAVAAELRFASFSGDRIMWQDFIEGIVSGTISTITLTLDASAVVEDSIAPVICTIDVPESRRAVVRAMRDSRVIPYVTPVCRA